MFVSMSYNLEACCCEASQQHQQSHDDDLMVSNTYMREIHVVADTPFSDLLSWLQSKLADKCLMQRTVLKKKSRQQQSRHEPVASARALQPSNQVSLQRAK